jgi:hypothetical protein
MYEMCIPGCLAGALLVLSFHVISLCSGGACRRYAQPRWSTITFEICGSNFLYYAVITATILRNVIRVASYAIGPGEQCPRHKSNDQTAMQATQIIISKPPSRTQLSIVTYLGDVVPLSVTSPRGLATAPSRH